MNMAEGAGVGPTCRGMGSRQDPVSSSGSCNFPEYELPELNTRAFYVGAFGELWRGRLRGEGDLSLKEPQAAALPESQGVSEWGQEDAAVARDLGCSLEAAAELRAVCGLDKLKCLEEGDDPEVIPEDTDLVTLGVRKRLLEQREETITIDRVCRQETFAYEMDLYKSAFFYFEGTFYNDKRYPECRDLSRTIIEWSESHDRGYGKFQTAKMEDFTFNDLYIKLGFPYLYCHQGDCEHVVVITDIRLVHRDDCLDRTLYPLLIKKHWLWTRKCFVCKMYTARWVTNNDSFAPEDPCFFCDVCFRMLHYDSEGNKLGEFLAYPYVDPGTFN
ncbi:snRNA-activating protein complex subunit 3 isoform X3 [Hyaena hyaena]|uniref:snRNA-activating protein complex subunit 3 isoform X3 n=1 Tax=Hyaena hyaena TaxID=95912 RepID=UPI001924392C|nr:snRNA-activating protein complex subunit 3 isoform X3 [Hyaena hyaena]